MDIKANFIALFIIQLYKFIKTLVNRKINLITQ